jgi:mannose-6-phosphate isomerase-like protein (cupin superfamily)
MKTTIFVLLGSILLGISDIFSLDAQVIKSPITKEIKKQYTIETCLNKFSMDKIIKTDVGYQYWFADADFIDGRTLKMSVVGPRQATHAPHSHAEDEFFFILEGTAELYLAGKKATAGPYASFYCPSNIEHGIKNAGDTELKYLVIRKYEKE